MFSNLLRFAFLLIIAIAALFYYHQPKNGDMFILCAVHKQDPDQTVYRFLTSGSFLASRVDPEIMKALNKENIKKDDELMTLRKHCPVCKLWWIPAEYDTAQKQLTCGVQEQDKLKVNLTYWVIPFSDDFVCKKKLPEICFSMWGRKAWEFLPLSLTRDLERWDPTIRDQLRQSREKRVGFILKKNIQRQKGLEISETWDRAYDMFHADPKYVVLQTILFPRYRLNGYKVNCRIYMAVLISKGKLTCSYFHDGFMYYAPGQSDSLSPKDIITTGYIDREIYNRCPLTIQDWIRSEPATSPAHSLFSISSHALHQILSAWFHSHKTELNQFSLHQATWVQWFGVDVQPDQSISGKNTVSIIEINKAPNLSPHSTRDAALKSEMLCSLFQFVKSRNENSAVWVPFFVSHL